MNPISTKRQINAPVSTVFQTVADIRNFSQAAPHVTTVEFLTERQSGVGRRFCETRLMGGKEVQTELEVTEFVENDRIRLVTDSGGTIWDTVLTVQPPGGNVELAMVMEI
jgi:uncharacterized membrane protein